MRKSSGATARSNDQYEFEDLLSETDVHRTRFSSEEVVSFPNSLEFPDFRAYERVDAEAARRAGRADAASVSEREYKKLLDERQGLIDKELSGSSTRKEAIRLEFVNWQLDRIEDAKYGEPLDVLDGLVTRYESFLSDVSSLRADLARTNKRAKR